MATRTKQPKKSTRIPALKPMKLSEGAVVVDTPKVAPGNEFIGYTGTTIYGGYFQEEYLNDLQGPVGREVYEKMRRGDAQIRKILTAIKNPIRSAVFRHEATDKDAKAEEIADFLNWQWLENPNFRFNKFINEVLTFLDFGFSVHEKRFTTHDHPELGQVTILGGLGFRKQRTIERWNITPQGLASIHQQVFGDTSKDCAQNVTIPAANLILFANEEEGDNYEGVSLLRASYGAWFRKNLFLKLTGIGIEKSSIGTPVGHYPKGATKEQKEDFVEMMGNLSTNEQSFITYPEGFKVDIFRNDFDASKTRDAVLYEDGQMSGSTLMGFLELGQNGNGGAYALGTDQSDFAMAALQFIGDYICEQMHKVDRDLVAWNYGADVEVPWPRCTGIQKAGKELADLIKTYVDAKVIRPDDALEDSVRETHNLPAAETTREEDAAKAPKIEPQPPVAPGSPPSFTTGTPTNTPTTPTKAEQPPKGKEGKFAEPLAPGARWRALTVYEQPLSLSEIEGQFTTESDKIAIALREEIAVIRDKSLAWMAKALKANPNDRLAVARDFSPSPTQLRKKLLAFMANAVGTGAKEAQAELSKKLGAANFAEKDSQFIANTQFLPKHVRDALEARAWQTSNDVTAAIAKKVAFGIIAGVEMKSTDAAIGSEIEDGINEWMDSAQVDTSARTTACQAINQGRNGFFQENLTQLQAFQYSAIIDDRTSDICLSLDGKIMKTTDPDLAKFTPPNHWNCRSILVPITINEEKPVITGIEPDPSNPALVEQYRDRGRAVPDMKKIKKSWNLSEVAA